MGRLLGVSRLVIGDIKRRRVEALLLLAMIATTTTTLGLGLALRGVANNPWARTRAATSGPDVAAIVGLAPGPTMGALATPGIPGRGTIRQFTALMDAPGVVGSSGPYPVAILRLTVHGRSVQALAEGRDRASVSIDQPLVTSGRWVRPGGVVIERSLADALRVDVGDTITVDGSSVRVSGLAVSTALPFYPEWGPGLIWLTRTDAERFARLDRGIGYALNLKLADPAAAPSFAAEHSPNPSWLLTPWQLTRSSDAKVIANEQKVLLIASWLLALLATASIAVLVGGRMAEQTRRVGLLKAVGATPRLVAVVLLAENLVLALAAAVIGVAAAQLLAPLLTNPGSGLLATPVSPPLTGTSIAIVAGVAVTVAAAATLAPALRGARTSTISALNNPAHPPGRSSSLIAISSRLPVPLMLGLRLIARRRRRAALTAVSLTIAVAMVVATLTLRHHVDAITAQTSALTLPGSSNANHLSHVVFLLSATLGLLAAISAIVTTWTTVLDAQRATALARALGATPRQITTGLTTAQLLPAAAAACLGIPIGLGLYVLAGGAAGANPPISWLLALIPTTLIAIAALTAIPARIGAHRPIAEMLRAE